MDNICLLTLPIRMVEDILKTRQRARQLSALLKFDNQAQIRIATAVSEIARNAYTYAGAGEVIFSLATINQKAYFTILIRDKGAGITNLPDIVSSTAMQGRGILSAKKLMDSFSIKSLPNQGTTVKMGMLIPSAMLPINKQTVANITEELVSRKVESVSSEILQQNEELLHAFELLNQARNELEERVKERTLALTQANDALQLEIKAKGVITQSLEEMTQQLNMALKSARMGTWSWNITYDKWHFDNYLQQLLGWTILSEKISSEQVLNHVYQADRQSLEKKLEEAKKKTIEDFDAEFRIIHEDKSLHTLAIRGKLYEEHNNDLKLLGICWDVTEHRETEVGLHKYQQELAQAAHKQSMGEMGSALAHEINQPLTVITTFTQACIRKFADEHFDKEKILAGMKIVAEQAERAGFIVHRMKDFVRKGKLVLELTEINSLIQEAIHLINYEVSLPNFLFQLLLNDSLPPLKLDKIQIQQVLLNLIRNALEAMQESKMQTSKIITIRTSMKSSEQLLITISDNGPGFSSNNLEQLFQPYFTTKQEGMGMGLAISRSIIEAHGGQLIPVIVPDGGSFHLCLPIT